MDMHQPTRESIMRTVANEAMNNYDLVMPGTKARPVIDDKGKMRFDVIEPTILNPLSLRGSAEAQYLTRIDVMGGFFHKCSPGLKTAILAEFHQIGKSYMLRCKNMGETQLIRAVLGPRFPKDCDDIYLFPVVLEALLAQDNVQLALFTRDDDITELHAQFNDTSTSMDGQTVRGSIAISNSETGHSAIWIEPSIQMFGNMMVSNKHGDCMSRFIHRGKVPTVAEISEAINEAKRVAQVGITQYLEEARTFITVKQACKYMDDMVVLPGRFSNIIQNEIKDMEFIQKQDLMRRILLAVKELPLFQSINIRREVGDFVGMFRQTGSRMANIVNLIEQGE